MRFVPRGVQFSKSLPSKPGNPQRFPVRSWSVYVFDSKRSAPPHHWLVASFRTEIDARMAWEHLKAEHAKTRNLLFYMEPSEGEPHEVVQYFEKKFGSCPEFLRFALPQTRAKAAT